MFGRDLPLKTVMLSFDDGSLREYTDAIVAILKRYDEAETQFTGVLKLRPDFTLAANNHDRRGNYMQAVRWLQNTLKTDPSRAVACVDLGEAYPQMGDTAKAKHAFQTYLELQPSGASAACAHTQLQTL